MENSIGSVCYQNLKLQTKNLTILYDRMTASVLMYIKMLKTINYVYYSKSLNGYSSFRQLSADIKSLKPLL